MSAESPPAPVAARDSRRRIVLAFVALAVLAGPATSFVASPAGLGAQWLGAAGVAAGGALTGVVLLALAVARREQFPSRRQWIALVALFVPQWLAGLIVPPTVGHVAPWLHATPWGIAFFASLAAPLWLGLLSALQLVPEEVPRAVAGAGIAGLGAACLFAPTDAYAVAPNQIPAAGLHALLAVLAVLSWNFARPRLAVAGSSATAGCFLLLTALGQAVMLPLAGGDIPSALDWRGAAVPLLAMVLVNAASWWLWFWLLKQMTLGGFSLRALAAWTATMLPGLALFWVSWRIDAAVILAVGALVVGLRAGDREEQPTALRLGGA